ncbi:MAG: 2OG-Fe(II) oxygenase [Deltaproteobacteria bacterium]|nr:2OG-Fe(II) oxygenase [Deltaproteobacteria bacterium]
MLNEITAALAAIKGRGSFATDLVCGSAGLHIDVQGVGPIQFPISAATARKLCTVGRPAPFGRRNQTLQDKRVRDTSEIAPELIKIEERAWRGDLEPMLARIQSDLGLPDDGSLDAVLDKLLVYGPGQFFAPHQDSERSDDMVGSLIVELPCQHEGGSLTVQHHEESRIFRGRKRGPKDCAVYAFYADCNHEVKPVKSGYRVTLTYHLVFKSGDGLRHGHQPVRSQRLVGAVKEYFSTPVATPCSRPPRQNHDRLVYLLDHEYTQRGLKFAQLKNIDRSRVEALAHVAESLDCEMYLALADVHECWSCEEDELTYGYRRRRYSRWRYDEDDETHDEPSSGKADDYELIDLVASDVELRHFVDLKGNAATGMSVEPTNAEICFTRASDELDPFKSEHEGYMGNYGNTVDRWYHRAAVIMWPRERNFVIRAKATPSWAIKELRSLIKAGNLEDARSKAKDLLPFWEAVADRETTAGFVHGVFSVAVAMTSDTAFGLLAPFGPERLDDKVVPIAVDLIECYGFEWGKRLFIAWEKDTRLDAPQWLPKFPALAQALVASRPHGATLIRWLVKHEAEKFRRRHAGKLKSAAPFSDKTMTKRYLDDLASHFVAAAVTGASNVRDELIAILTSPDQALAPELAADLLASCLEASRPIGARDLGLQRFYEHVIGQLEMAINTPVRNPDNWSIQPPKGCSCDLCKELASFLRASTRVRFEWPLSKERRFHIHGIIDRHLLPVTHTTIHMGSPHKLVLTKQEALFARDQVQRERQKECLVWLRDREEAFRSGW